MSWTGVTSSSRRLEWSWDWGHPSEWLLEMPSLGPFPEEGRRNGYTVYFPGMFFLSYSPMVQEGWKILRNKCKARGLHSSVKQIGLDPPLTTGHPYNNEKVIYLLGSDFLICKVGRVGHSRVKVN